MIKPSVRFPVLAIFGLLFLLLFQGCSGTTFGATAVPSATSTPAATATSTLTPTRTPEPTWTPNPTATVLAEARNKMMEGYFNDGYISWQNGQYYHLNDFSQDWAQIGWYRWWETGFFPRDFVFKADFAWETGSKTPDLNSGCGFVFHAEDNDNHYMVYLGMDGYVHAMRYLGGRFARLGDGYFGKLTNPGQATFTLISSGNNFHTFVNDEFVKSFTGSQGKLSSGTLAYTVYSGTNKDFGTRCKMTNISLWYPKE